MDYDDFLNIIKVGAIGILAIAVFFFSIISIGQWIALNANRVPVIAYVDNNEVYRGINGCIDTKSLGINTQVIVNGGYLCLFTRKVYVSSNVRIVNQ